MGIFSRKPKVQAPPNVGDLSDLATAGEDLAYDVGAFVADIRANEPLMTYLTKTLVPKLAPHAITQNLAGMQKVINEDPVVGSFIGPAFAAFTEGLNS